MDNIKTGMINQSYDDYIQSQKDYIQLLEDNINLLLARIKHLELDNKLYHSENIRYRDKLSETTQKLDMLIPDEIETR